MRTTNLPLKVSENLLHLVRVEAVQRTKLSNARNDASSRLDIEFILNPRLRSQRLEPPLTLALDESTEVPHAHCF